LKTLFWCGTTDNATPEEENMAKPEVTIDELKQVWNYDPDTGIFTWKVRPFRNSKQMAGDVAGREVRSKGTEKTAYWYLYYKSFSFNASMVAWAFTYGEWPDRKLRFIDGDGLNTRVGNLKKDERYNVYGEGYQPGSNGYNRHPELILRDRLKYHYGLELHEFKKMMEDQNGCCAICERPERAMVNGKVKPLSVDHCHATGKVRGLLCSHCNHMLGHAEDKVEILAGGIDYIEKHQRLAEAPLPNNVVKLKEAR
jgi:hypothetical protein